MNFEDADNGVYHIECPEGDVTYTHKVTKQTTLDDYAEHAGTDAPKASLRMEDAVRSFKGASKVRDPYPHFNEMIFDQNFRCNEYVHMRNGTEFAKELKADAIADPELRTAMEVWIAQAAELDRALRLLIEMEKAEPKFCWRGQRMPEEGKE